MPAPRLLLLPLSHHQGVLFCRLESSGISLVEPATISDYALPPSLTVATTALFTSLSLPSSECFCHGCEAVSFLDSGFGKHLRTAPDIQRLSDSRFN